MTTGMASLAVAERRALAARYRRLDGRPAVRSGPIATHPSLLGRQLPFIVVALVWSFLPATVTPWITVADIPVDGKDVALASLCVLYAALAFMKRRLASGPGFAVLMQTWAIAGYAFVSITWSAIARPDTQAMTYTLVMAVASACCGYGLIAALPPERVKLVLWQIAQIIAVVSAVYLAESMSLLHLRSEDASWWTDFGIQRVRGPLFGSSTGHFVLLPALAIATSETVRSRANRLRGIACVLAITMALLGLGSRSALLAFVVFSGLSCLVMLRKRSWRWIAFIVSAEVLAAAVIFSQASGERLTTFTDVARSQTHATTWQIITDESPVQQLAGRGYGDLWPWYLTDVEFGGAAASGAYYSQTEYGFMLYHPHSLFLLLAAELGIAGLCFFGLLCSRLIWLARKASNKADGFLACAMVATGLGFFFDLIIFKSWPLSAIWWTFLFGCCSQMTAPVLRPRVNSRGQMLNRRATR